METKCKLRCDWLLTQGILLEVHRDPPGTINHPWEITNFPRVILGDLVGGVEGILLEHLIIQVKYHMIYIGILLRL